jgi:LacI family transcriptional regulator
MGSVTLNQVAQKARVSASTASLILNGSPERADSFATKTRDRVQVAAAELGYRANTAARTTATGRFNCLTLLLSRQPHHSVLPLGLLEGVESVLESHDQRLAISRLPDTQLTDSRKVPDLLRELSSDGLLINYNAHVPPAMVRLVKRYRLPAVWINSLHEADCVRPDDYAAGRDLTRLLLERGHRKIAFLEYNWGDGDLQPHYSFDHRFAGYRDALAEAGLSPRHLHGGGDVPYDQRIRLSNAWLSADDVPDAVMAYGSNDIEPVLIAMDRRGLTIDRDLAVATFHDIVYERYDLRVLTAVIPSAEVGSAASRMLLKEVECGETAASRVIPFRIVDERRQVCAVSC